MRAVASHRFGSPDVLRLEEVPTPTPGPGDVLIRVRSTVVTPPDCAARSGRPWAARLAFGPIRPRATVLGGMGAGVIEEVGGEVGAFAKGDRVVAAPASFGTHAEYLCVSAAGAIASIPDEVTDDDAVAVGEGGLTALPFLRDHARLRRGQRILVNGASGSVGSAAVQLARLMGAEVTGVCGPTNLDLVRALGADDVIDYTTRDPLRTGATYDVVFDAVGTRSFADSRHALAAGGVYLTTVPSLAILRQTLTSRVGRRRAAIAFTGLRPARDRAKDLAELLGLLSAGEMTAVIDRRYPLEETADAHRHVETGHKRGTVIVTVEPQPARSSSRREAGRRGGVRR